MSCRQLTYFFELFRVSSVRTIITRLPQLSCFQLFFCPFFLTFLFSKHKVRISDPPDLICETTDLSSLYSTKKVVNSAPQSFLFRNSSFSTRVNSLDCFLSRHNNFTRHNFRRKCTCNILLNFDWDLTFGTSCSYVRQ